jgi:hypothetical protein
MDLELIRSERNPDGTFGEMTVPMPTAGAPLILKTCEDDWLDNARGRSCIPEGDYILHRTVYVKHGYETFEVTGVPGRARILIHPGSTEEDTMGCILVGLRRGKILVAKDEDTGAANRFKEAVLESQVAFHHHFMPAMQGVDQAFLHVMWAAGLP